MILRTPRRLAVALTLVVCLIVSNKTLAEPVLVSIEGQAAMAVTEPQRSLFGIGGAGALAIHYPLSPWFLIGVRLHAGLLSNGDPPRDPGLADPGNGTFELAMLTLRIRPFAGSAGLRRATGLFLDVSAGGGVTGQLGRAGFSGGIGYGFPIGTLALAPTLRYLQILQPTTVLASDDARLLMLGLELTFGDNMKPPPPVVAAKPAPPVVVKAPEPSDRDHDGIDDAHDKCPDQPEDHDGFQDDDGCPDPDNDGDRIPDVQDKCPNEPEDYDDFEDTDGCPDPDNDHDGFPDAEDQCPNEAEVVNGNKDYDGCPDEGLIVMENNRIVLEERVLFEFERARVSHAAIPVLKAIVALKAQHPEWKSLRVEGHADARGDAGYNQELSELRAAHVVQELVKLGIPQSQIHAIGYGSTRLRDHRDEEEAHKRNRRVEFVVETQSPTQPSAATPTHAESRHHTDSGDASPPPPPPPGPTKLEPPASDKPAHHHAAKSQHKTRAGADAGAPANDDAPAPPKHEATP